MLSTTHFVLTWAAAILLAGSLHAVPTPDQNQNSPDEKGVAADAPMRKPSLPGNVTYIAVDTDNREVVAYHRDGSMLGRYPLGEGSDSVLNERAAPSCGNLPIEEAKTLPGWNAIEKYADDNWGDGSRNILTNPKEYPDMGAQFCVSDQVVELSLDNDPICHNMTVAPTGAISNTSGAISVETDQGWKTGSTQTVTKTSTIGVNSTFSFTAGVRGIASASESVTVFTEFTNSQSTAFDVQYQDTGKVTVNLATKDGKQCGASLTTTSCDTQTTGKIQILATGWVWFNYDNRQKGHYKWAANIEAVLSENDRSSWAEFRGSMASEMKSVFKGTCA